MSGAPLVIALIVAVFAALVLAEMILRRNRRRPTLAERFEARDGEPDALGTEATDMRVLDRQMREGAQSGAASVFRTRRSWTVTRPADPADYAKLFVPEGAKGKDRA